MTLDWAKNIGLAGQAGLTLKACRAVVCNGVQPCTAEQGKQTKKGTVTESLCYELLRTVSIPTNKPSPALDSGEWYHYALSDGGDSV